MNCLQATCLALLFIPVFSAQAQVSPKDVNGASNSADAGTSFDTNVTFTLRMTLAGDDTPRDTAFLGDEVSIITTIRPEAEDIGNPADIILVDYLPPMLTMRNTDGNFVTWNGSLQTLVPYLEDVTLEAELEVEVFSGQMGTVGNHRIFVGFLVSDVLYFTPMALRFDMEEAQQSASELAMALFESTISPNIVQARCITCHVANGLADGQAAHIFVRISNPDHLTLNFAEFEQVHEIRGAQFILNKVQGFLGHGGGAQLSSSSNDFSNLEDFLELLDQAAETSSNPLNDSDDIPIPDVDEVDDPYAYGL